MQFSFGVLLTFAVALAKRYQDASHPAKPGEQYTIAEADFIQIQRSISPWKGKWRQVPPDAETQK
jgi:hypothetical protein